MSLLHPLVDHYNQIPSAFFIAQFIETSGEMGLTIEIDNIEKAIQAYFRVLFLINLGPNYPYDPNYRLYEVNVQAELQSTYIVLYLYLNIYYCEIYDPQKRLLQISPGFEGERNLTTYRKYSPYTMVDTLSNVIEFANRYLALPNKPHFNPQYYKAYQKACRILKDAAEALMPMELEVLNIVASESCGKDLPKYRQKYEELDASRMSILDQAVSELRELFSIDTK